MVFFTAVYFKMHFVAVMHNHKMHSIMHFFRRTVYDLNNKKNKLPI